MLYKTYEKNSQGSDYIIGDLHGCYDMLMEKMEEISFDPKKDRMFSVGDLIDRGPKNMECLRLMKEDWFHAIKGNHEDLMICALLDGNRPDVWTMNGGRWAYEPGVDQDELLDLAYMAADLPVAMTIETSFGKIGVTHAEPPRDWHSIGNGMGRGPQYDLIWSRRKIQKSRNEMVMVKNIDYTVHGHTPVYCPVTVGNSVYIDTGAVFNGMEILGGKTLEGYLTCLPLDDIPDFAINTAWPKVKKELKSKQKKLFD